MTCWHSSLVATLLAEACWGLAVLILGVGGGGMRTGDEQLGRASSFSASSASSASRAA